MSVRSARIILYSDLPFLTTVETCSHGLARLRAIAGEMALLTTAERMPSQNCKALRELVNVLAASSIGTTLSISEAIISTRGTESIVARGAESISTEFVTRLTNVAAASGILVYISVIAAAGISVICIRTC